MKKELEKLALDTIYTLSERGDLETRNNDGEDFIEMPIWSIKELLEKAYELGKENAK